MQHAFCEGPAFDCFGARVHTLATLIVCCSMASCMVARSCSRTLANSSMQHSPPSARTKAPASSCHSAPSCIRWAPSLRAARGAGMGKLSTRACLDSGHSQPGARRADTRSEDGPRYTLGCILQKLGLARPCMARANVPNKKRARGRKLDASGRSTFTHTWIADQQQVRLAPNSHPRRVNMLNTANQGHHHCKLDCSA